MRCQLSSFSVQDLYLLKSESPYLRTVKFMINIVSSAVVPFRPSISAERLTALSFIFEVGHDSWKAPYPLPVECCHDHDMVRTGDLVCRRLLPIGCNDKGKCSSHS